MIDMQLIASKFNEYVFSYGPKILLAILTLVIGLWVVKWIVSMVKKALKVKKVEPTLVTFLGNITGGLLKVILFIAVIGILGVETTSFVAVLAAMGFAIGMALQGSLGNFAAGVLIILLKPYVKGEVIEAQGFTGKVASVEIFNTILKTPDNKTVILPNGATFNNPITNYTREKLRRVDFTIGIGYDDDMKKANKVLNKIIKGHKKVLKEPAPFVRMGELADSSVNFTVRAWAKTEDYWDVHFGVTETVKETFDKEGIGIPYPQMDVHMKKD